MQQAEFDNKKNPISTEEKVKLLAEAAADKKAEFLKIYITSELCSYADYIAIASANSERHALSIADEVLHRAKRNGLLPLGTEGLNHGQWILLDFGDIIFHIFNHPVRLYYELDRFWGEAPQFQLENVTYPYPLPLETEGEEE